MRKPIVFLLSLAFSLTPFLLFGEPSSIRKKILIFHSYPPGEWYHGINGMFEQTLGQLGVQPDITPIVFHSEFWLRKSSQEQDVERARLVRIAKNLRPDLVLLCDDEATDFLAAPISKLGIPILFTGVNEDPARAPWFNQVPRSNMAGVLEHYQIAESIQMLKKIRPSVKSMSILSSKNLSSEIITRQLVQQMRSPQFEQKHGVKLRSVHTLRYWEEWKKVVPEINRQDQALWILVPYDVRDLDNQEVPISQIGNWLTKHSDLPTLGIVSIHTKMGLFAAINIAPESLGRQAAEQAARYFKGELLEKIGFENARYFKMEINMTEAKRLKIKIPKDLLGIASFVDSPVLKYGR
jgi:ABC-type uncharacterized transport system substrate-binding protein